MTKLLGFEVFRFSGQKWVCDLEKWVKVAESGSVYLGPPGVHTVCVSCLSDKLRLERKKERNKQTNKEKKNNNTDKNNSLHHGYGEA